MDYEVTVTAIDENVIRIRNSNMLLGGEILIAKVGTNEEDNWLGDRKGQPVKKLHSIDALTAYSITAQIADVGDPLEVVVITDSDVKVSLFGPAKEYWREMMDACLASMK